MFKKLSLNRIAAILLSLFMILSSVPVFAESKPIVSVGNAAGKAGDQVSVKVCISGNPGIAYLKLEIGYDASQLTLIDAANKGLLSGTYVTSQTKDVNPYVLQWMGAENSIGNGDIATLTFKISPNASAGDKAVSVRVVESCNQFFDDVEFSASGGNINVTPETTKTLQSVSVYSLPTKTVYYQGDSLNTSGMKLKLTYSDGSTEIVSSGFTTSGFSSATAGTKTVTVSYEGKTTTFTVTVKPTIVTFDKDRIDLKISGNKTATVTATIDGNYTHWQCDWDGSVIGVEKKQNGNKITMTVTARTIGTSKLLLKAQDENYNTISEKYIYVTVTDDVTLSSVSVKTKPTKTEYYIGDVFKSDGLQLELIYSDTSTKTVSDGFKLSGFDSASAGTKTVTVSYEGKTTTFTVTVNTPTIVASVRPTNALMVGDKATLTAHTEPVDRVVTWSSSDSSVASISGNTLIAKSSGTTEITAKFTYNGIVYSKSFLVSISYQSDVVISSKNIDTAVGELITVPVVLNSDLPISGGEFVLKYDSSMLEVKSYEGVHDDYFINVNTNTGIDGTIKCNFLEHWGASDKAFGADKSIVKFQFLVKSKGESSIEFDDVAIFKYEKNDPEPVDLFVKRCSGRITTKGAEPLSVSIYINPKKTTYYIGETLDTYGLTLEIVCRDGSRYLASTGFTTSEFDSQSAGTRNITVFYGELKTEYTVDVRTPSILISNRSDHLWVGDTTTLWAATEPGGQDVIWSSSDTNIATVSGGVVHARSAGNVTITAEFTYCGKRYFERCDITVSGKVMLGDFDGDKRVTKADVIYLLNYTLLPGRYPISGGFADFNHDGTVNKADVIYLLNYTLMPDRYPITR